MRNARGLLASGTFAVAVQAQASGTISKLERELYSSSSSRATCAASDYHAQRSKRTHHTNGSMLEMPPVNTASSARIDTQHALSAPALGAPLQPPRTMVRPRRTAKRSLIPIISARATSRHGKESTSVAPCFLADAIRQSVALCGQFSRRVTLGPLSTAVTKKSRTARHTFMSSLFVAEHDGQRTDTRNDTAGVRGGDEARSTCKLKLVVVLRVWLVSTAGTHSATATAVIRVVLL